MSTKRRTLRELTESVNRKRQVAFNTIETPRRPDSLSPDQWIRMHTGHVRREKMKRYFDPSRCPFARGNIVACAVITSAAEMSQVYTVSGAYLSGSGNGWFIYVVYGIIRRTLGGPTEHRTLAAGRLHLVPRKIADAVYQQYTREL